MKLRYVICDTLDPEERVEDAALWKAMHDHYGAAIEAVAKPVDDGVLWFGRGNRFGRNVGQIGTHRLPYWTDAVFLANCRRQFTVLPILEVGEEVERLHALGLGAFLKSTREKHCIVRAPVGSDWQLEVGDMAYSFIDGGPDLMVQELVEIADEFRFFVIGRRVVTWSLNRPELTPLAKSPRSPPSYLALAWEVAEKMATADAVVDIGLINGSPGVVEFNPLVLGCVGLFACDVAALARASEALLPREPGDASNRDHDNQRGKESSARNTAKPSGRSNPLPPDILEKT
jgi:hypothetical protein